MEMETVLTTIIGMKVAYNKNASQIIVHEGIEYLHMSESEIQALISEDGEAMMTKKWILIESLAHEKIELASGIVYSPTSRSVMPIGRIVTCGPDVTTVTPGMKVVHNLFADQPFFFQGKSYIRMSEIDYSYILLFVRIRE